MKGLARVVLLTFVLFIGVLFSATTVFADGETATITYVVSEEALDGLEAMDPPAPFTGDTGFVVHHIPTLSSSVYTFLGWYYYVGEEQVKLQKYDVIANDLTVYGKWRLTPRVVSYDLDGGTNDPTNPYIVYANQTYPLADPEKAGYAFQGWLLDGNPVTELVGITSSIDLVATWQIITSNLTVNNDNGDDPYVLSVTYGDSYSLIEPSKTGYVFDGWKDLLGNSFPATGTIALEADDTVTAQWLPATDTAYSIVTHTENILDDEYQTSTEDLTGTTGETVTLVPEAQSGFVLNTDLSVLEGVIAADGSLVLHIYYDRLEYTVTFLDEDAETLKTEVVKYMGDATPPVYEVPGYTTSWTTAEFQDVTADVSTQVTLTANTYTVTFTSETSETFDPQTATYNQPLGTLPTPTPPAYKVFNGWKTAGGTYYTAASIYNVVGDLALIAEFIEETDVTYTVKYAFENTEGVFVVNDTLTTTGTGTAGDTATATALDPLDVPAGFELVTPLPSGIITTAGDGLILTVQYQRITLTVTFAHYEEDVLTSTDVDVKYGLTVVAPTLDVRTGYTFASWDASLENITSAQTITAEYDLVTYTITYVLYDDLSNDPATFESPVVTYTIESGAALVEPSRLTFAFEGWYDNAGLTGDPLTAIAVGAHGDLTLHAAWSVITYTVTFDNSDVVTEEVFEVVVEASQTVDEADFPVITVPAGKTLYYWVDGDENEFTSETIVESDLTVYPFFISVYDITFYDYDTTTVIASDTYIIGESVVVPDLPSENGYSYAWDQTPPVVATADMDITAIRTLITYTITYETLGEATNGNPSTYTVEDATITLSDPGTREGFAFDRWADAEFGGNEVTEITTGSYGDVTVYAQWISLGFEVENKGFETGDLYGWNVYNIWKNETGMQAWEDARVISDTYFGSNPYDRDGSYNLGIVWSAENGNGSWDASSERMGHLRSSDFELGGSGWISFKLGGGRDESFAYVSVRRADTNKEVARFGNRHYNDTGVASTQYGSTITNAEAFMFQYYFDLLAVDGVSLGDEFYFVITDASSFSWTILSADSFETYYTNVPTPSADELADNIVPTIDGIATATNQIVSGNPFVSGLTGWTNVTGNFRFDGDGARSDQGGDGATGVLRSSAFSIDGDNKYLRFEWAGGLKYDKQIFISIKEVGTNIEVIRIVRRDSLSGKEDNNFDNHMADLSGLDTTKLYYIEIADDRDGGWGVSHVKSVRLINQAEWDGVVVPHPGDEAAYISGLVTDYTYVPEV
ncbi:MAG: InlB B-repeat-containing protein [Acholeplasmataceae bacterium]|nr:InlB B-repeat-containing protein [Acholeplasmataceae bacterium]